MQRRDGAVTLGVKGGFHLHRLDGHQEVAGNDRTPARDRHRGDDTGHRGGDVARVGRIGLRAADDARRYLAVLDLDGARLAVQLEEDAHRALLVGLAHGQAADMTSVCPRSISTEMSRLGTSP